MESRKIVIWGASGHAKVVAEIVLSQDYEIAAFIDTVNPGQPGDRFMGRPLWTGMMALETALKCGVNKIIIAFGDCRARLGAARIAASSNFSFVSALHPSAVISPTARLGEGVVVAAGAVINADAEIGDHVIVNTCASVDHDCCIEEGVHLAPGVRLAGNVAIGRGTFVGIGTVVMEKMTIGKGAMLGAGSVVVKNVPDCVLAYGAPAKVMKQLPAF